MGLLVVTGFEDGFRVEFECLVGIYKGGFLSFGEVGCLGVLRYYYFRKVYGDLLF